MLGAKSGIVTPANEVGGGAQATIINIHNAPPGTYAISSPDGMTTDVFIGKMKKALAADAQANEREFFKALTRYTNVRGRLS